MVICILNFPSHSLSLREVEQEAGGGSRSGSQDSGETVLPGFLCGLLSLLSVLLQPVA